jgi:DNA-directed RNA polymerase subunit RPC12/RpoP
LASIKEVKNMEEKIFKIECPHCGNQILFNVIKPELKEKVSIDAIKVAIDKWADCVDVVEHDNTIVITPKAYLGRDVWQEINDALKPFNPEWISAKKESRWVIKASE